MLETNECFNQMVVDGRAAVDFPTETNVGLSIFAVYGCVACLILAGQLVWYWLKYDMTFLLCMIYWLGKEILVFYNHAS